LLFEPVFDYEHVLVVGENHPLRHASYAEPEQLAGEVLFTYPVSNDRLDIYTRFLTPAGIYPRRHKLIETTEIMLQMVASGRGVAAMPRWVVEDYGDRYAVHPVHLGIQRVDKQIFLGIRKADVDIDYLRAFLELARTHRDSVEKRGRRR
jgi:LysR family transcriptional regulator for metE and metH